MKLSRRIRDRITPELVSTTNQLYHDLQSAASPASGARIYRIEKKFWYDVAQKFLLRKEPLVCLDFGTGAGAVPLAVAGFLKKDDVFICSDISEKMLEKCKHNIKQKEFPCHFRFITAQEKHLPLPNNSVDVLTMNSVLHHIFDLSYFAKEVTRILKPHGIVIDAH